MKYLLDTNVCVAILRGRPNMVAQRLSLYTSTDVALCAVVKAELFYGAYHGNDPVSSLSKLAQFVEPFASLPFDDQAARIAGDIRAQLAAQGTPIGSNDLHIAAIAIVHNLVLVTHNTREFRRIATLKIEDWEQVG